MAVGVLRFVFLLIPYASWTFTELPPSCLQEWTELNIGYLTTAFFFFFVILSICREQGQVHCMTAGGTIHMEFSMDVTLGVV